MSVKQITPEQAKQLLDSDAAYVYVDVRSEAEFVQGHPSGAINIPISQLSRAAGMLQENPDFLDVIQANFDKDAKLLLGCASGNRSNVAGRMLQQLGYEDVANIQAGFSGKRDMFGRVTQPGWMQLGYPVSTGDEVEGSYQKIREKLGQTTDESNERE